LSDNFVVLRGRLVERDTLRYTPAGIPMMKFRMAHESKKAEAGVSRNVSFEIQAVAFEREAGLLAAAPLGMELKVTGFLDKKGRSSATLVLHATQIEFV